MSVINLPMYNNEQNFLDEILENAKHENILIELSNNRINFKFKCCEKTYEKRIQPDIRAICIESAKSVAVWKKYREFRITGSSCNSLFTYCGKDWRRKALSYFWPKQFTNKYVKHGISTEKIAREIYIAKQKLLVGFIVAETNPWLGFSPGGIVIQNGKHTKLLEIKCPFEGTNSTVDSSLAKLPYLKIENNVITIKKKNL